jgi:hypothetical protein
LGQVQEFYTERRKIIYIGLGVASVLAIALVYSQANTNSGLQGNLFGSKASTPAVITVTIDGKSTKPLRVPDLSKGLKPILGSIDKKYGTNLAVDKNGLVSSIGGFMRVGVTPTSGLTNGNLLINGSLNPFSSRQNSSQDVSGMGLDSLNSFRDRTGFVSTGGKTPSDETSDTEVTYGEDGKPVKLDPKTGLPQGETASGGTTTSGDETSARDRGIQRMRDAVAGIPSTTTQSEDRENRRFTREIAPRSEDPTSDKAYGKATASDLTVDVLTKNQALGAGTVKSPTSLGGKADSLADGNYGTTNPRDGASNTRGVSASNILGVNVTLDCARSMGETYCGSNSSVNIQISIIPNPNSGGVGGNPVR